MKDMPILGTTQYTYGVDISTHVNYDFHGFRLDFSPASVVTASSSWHVLFVLPFLC